MDTQGRFTRIGRAVNLRKGPKVFRVHINNDIIEEVKLEPQHKLKDVLPLLENKQDIILDPSIFTLQAPNKRMLNLDGQVGSLKATELFLEPPYSFTEASKKKLFGEDLSRAVAKRKTTSGVPYVLEQCLAFLDQEEILEELGLFRLSGSKKAIERYRRLFDSGMDVHFPPSTDPHVVTGLVKLYLKTLPEPLCTERLYDVFIEAGTADGEPERISRVTEAVKQLPVVNYQVLRYLAAFCYRLVRHAAVNKMPASNVAIVIGPNVFFHSDLSVMASHTSAVCAAMSVIIEHFPDIFPEHHLDINSFDISADHHDDDHPGHESNRDDDPTLPDSLLSLAQEEEDDDGDNDNDDDDDYPKERQRTKIWRRLQLMLRVTVLTVVLYNTISIPFRAAFVPQDTWYWLASDLLIDLVLLIDIAVNFFTPFTRNGIVQRHPRITALRYARTWFVFDALAWLPIDVLVWAGVLGDTRRALLRLNKLVRSLRLDGYFTFIEQRSNANPAVFRIAKFLFAIAMLAHWFGCAWFGVVVIEGEDATPWTLLPDLQQASRGSQYLHGLYWAVVSMTGYGGTMPRTPLETIFSLVTVFVGVSIYVSIIGTVGSLVANVDRSAALFRARMDAINDYMKYRQLPNSIQDRVRLYYTYLWKSRKGLNEEEILRDLPSYLRMAVSMHLNKDIVEKVPLFQDAINKGTNSNRFIGSVLMCLKPRVALPHAQIVRKGEIGREMFFITRGNVEILKDNGDVLVTLDEGKYFGEIALVFDLERTASVRAGTYCDLFVLEKGDFDEIMRQYPDEARHIQEQAEERLNQMKK
eukprot:gb/GECH01014786.1/.p1 GENE.gb/GECH01014786.1/~~gb/GECH01014786.1/.p1  ORF type:complete len:809 (+),score=184.27 gb/GECH01014786.1/:1-2427(+)